MNFSAFRLISFITLFLIISSISIAAKIPESRQSLNNYSCPKDKNVAVAFFDADSTLRVSKIEGSNSAENEKDVNILPFVASSIKALNDAGFLVAVVSNQGGVQLGYITKEIANGALLYMISRLNELGARVDYYDFAERYDQSRKPNTGMADLLARKLRSKCDLDIDWNRSIMIGDSGYKKKHAGDEGKNDENNSDGEIADDFSNSDRIFAENLREKYKATYFLFFEPKDYFGWKREFGILNIHSEDELKDFLVIIEGKIARLKEKGASKWEVERLTNEVSSLRAINGFIKKIRFVHFNIKELTTEKLLDLKNGQVKSAVNTIKNLNPDLLSINELQYDLPDIPKAGYPGTGENIARFLKQLNVDLEAWSWSFAQSNTGNNAIPFDNGDYPTETESPDARLMADQVNFGLFPGQYSTALATIYEIDARQVFTDIKWRDWNPDFEPSFYDLPEDVSLFDKSFIHTVVKIDGKLVNIITFHTVPAFDFGNDHSPNLFRNADQLSFLEWYMVGNCNSGDKSVVRQCNKYKNLRPLKEADLFIAVGDLNVDINSEKPGAYVLKRIINNPRIQNWMPEITDKTFKNRNVTHITDGIDIEKYKDDINYGQSQLDYFLVSKEFEIVGGAVYAPDSEFEEHGCYFNSSMAEKMALKLIDKYESEGMNRSVDLSWRGSNMCVVSTTKEFAEFRAGSDHFPIYVDLDLN